MTVLETRVAEALEAHHLASASTEAVSDPAFFVCWCGARFEGSVYLRDVEPQVGAHVAAVAVAAVLDAMETDGPLRDDLIGAGALGLQRTGAKHVDLDLLRETTERAFDAALRAARQHESS